MAGCEHSLFTARARGAEVAEAATCARPRRAQHTTHCWRPKRGRVPRGRAGESALRNQPAHRTSAAHTRRVVRSSPPNRAARRAGNVNAKPASPGPYCLTERGRDGDVVPGGGIVAGDGRNSPLTQRSGTHREGENGCIGDRPTGTVDGVRPEWNRHSFRIIRRPLEQRERVVCRTRRDRIPSAAHGVVAALEHTPPG